IDGKALKKAVRELTNRHAALRTKITLVNNSHVQIFPEAEDRVFQHVQLSHLPGDRREPEALRLLNEEYRTPMNVQKDLLFKVLLIEINEGDYLVVLKLNHIISDATTFKIIWRDLKQIYNSYWDETVELPKLSVQYQDYVMWQRESLTEQNTKAQENYWLNEFQGELPALDLPTDFLPSPQISFNGAIESVTVPKEVVQGLQHLSFNKRVILFSTLLSAYYVLLQKYCHQEDIVIGTVYAGRHYSSQLKDVAGFFVNTVAVRLNEEKEASFEDILLKIHEKVHTSYSMQDYQFERLVQRINPNRQNAKNPLFRTMFNMVSDYKESLRFCGIEAEVYVEPDINSTQVDLLFDVHNSDAEVEIRLEYNTDIFKPETISRLLKHYVNLLRSIINNPSAKVYNLEILDAAEQKQLLSEWNSTQLANSEPKCVHEIFAEQAKQTPHRIALMYKDETLTYAELNTKSNQLAQALVAHGVVPGSRVAIMTERSLAMIVGVLATMKAGGAYVPIDPAYPEDRKRYMLEDSESSVLLSQNGLADLTLETIHSTNLKTLNLNDQANYRGDGSDLNLVSSPENVAYILYTSGSTGKPKGVMIEHRAMLNTLWFMQSSYPVLADDTYLLKTTCTFDVSIAELFGWFFAGGKLAILDHGAEKEPVKIVDAIGKYKVTHLNFVPSMLNVFLDVIESKHIEVPQCLKFVGAGGEALPSNVVEKCHNLIPGAELVNLYGPTEVSIYSTTCAMRGFDHLQKVHIGKPVANMKAYVLNEKFKLQPVGVPGELFLSGPGLGRGYLNRPELTAEKFIANPFIDGARMYKTGDLVRLMSDGNIEFLGRIDHQVKIRGFRIELGEIEKTLLSHPQVKEAVVIVREDTENNKRIVAYVVMKANADSTTGELRQYVEKWLAHYMVPAAFVKLDQLPLNANGKVDRKALPIPDEEFEGEREYVQPQTQVEEKLIAITEDLLNVKGIGINDNFFSLGGNSLLTIRFVSEIENTFGISLSLIDFIDLPVIHEIAKMVEAQLQISATN
ncbi:MAG TPA: amino acid adenylation domain-containing protein, partial [Desulfobacteria bacterium]|nr:amino acid adenylation domain-containing protein [Desulfobacteria bacterium]